MSELADQTRTATSDITVRADAIAGNVGAAREVIEIGVKFLKVEHGMITAVADTAKEQRLTSESVARLTGESVERIEDAAVGSAGLRLPSRSSVCLPGS